MSAATLHRFLASHVAVERRAVAAAVRGIEPLAEELSTPASGDLAGNAEPLLRAGPPPEPRGPESADLLADVAVAVPGDARAGDGWHARPSGVEFVPEAFETDGGWTFHIARGIVPASLAEVVSPSTRCVGSGASTRDAESEAAPTRPGRGRVFGRVPRAVWADGFVAGAVACVLRSVELEAGRRARAPGERGTAESFPDFAEAAEDFRRAAAGAPAAGAAETLAARAAAYELLCSDMCTADCADALRVCRLQKAVARLAVAEGALTLVEADAARAAVAAAAAPARRREKEAAPAADGAPPLKRQCLAPEGCALRGPRPGLRPGELCSPARGSVPRARLQGGVPEG